MKSAILLAIEASVLLKYSLLNSFSFLISHKLLSHELPGSTSIVDISFNNSNMKEHAQS